MRRKRLRARSMAKTGQGRKTTSTRISERVHRFRKSRAGTLDGGVRIPDARLSQLRVSQLSAGVSYPRASYARAPSAASISVSAAARACSAASGVPEIAAVVCAPSASSTSCGARLGGAEDSLYWNANEDYLALNIFSEEQDDDVESLPAWSRLVDVALAAQSSKAGLDFIGLGTAVGASAYFGECDDPKVDGIADDFVDALARAGIRGAKPGVCISTLPY